MAADPMVDLRRRFTVDEYEHMYRSGVLGEDDRTELLDGEIVMMSPIGPRHSAAVSRINRSLVMAVLNRAVVRIQDAVRLLPKSEPQPDVVVARPRRDFYESAHPTAEDTLLVIEVADSSLYTDRAVKLPLYARQGIVEVWIVDLAARRVLVYSDPADGAYRRNQEFGPGEVLIPTTVPGVALPVSDVLGPEVD